mmetsp:Transcript_33245/g.50875  ORF Transcript_33245/g.50875 Transcript_33245/m.50875 type:complete len:87 (-) Transcript_33245:253-513(-)|eukprot:CAMPEP_0118697316 /NCGR_PEP_ID=MMETSP0800-20121206/14418_1 /TAXON_ID=210618 ORGANISM="Striatella unipunctata, Strain CCMP2910" /NCGR_SAMPLE_ID=MMETSP0800 /ASSEMBLY_ACC=CAM_ASM_000638 /LENGTH=86 /DNA_ID=CAMNT_0006596693 /DNA_START=287 /DNA_END=547 /DNA_ORIENTATION=+
MRRFTLFAAVLLGCAAGSVQAAEPKGRLGGLSAFVSLESEIAQPSQLRGSRGLSDNMDELELLAEDFEFYRLLQMGSMSMSMSMSM